MVIVLLPVLLGRLAVRYLKPDAISGSIRFTSQLRACPSLSARHTTRQIIHLAVGSIALKPRYGRIPI